MKRFLISDFSFLIAGWKLFAKRERNQKSAIKNQKL